MTTKKPAAFPERDLQAALLAALKRLPAIRAWRQQCGKVRVRGGFMQLAPSGAGDICGTVAPDGLHFEVEVKARKTAVQDEQDPWAAATAASGAVYYRARPMAYESLEDAVSRCVAELLASIAEARSRRGLAHAEAAIAEQVAHGGDAGDVVDDYEAAQRLLAEVEAPRKRGRRVA